MVRQIEQINLDRLFDELLEERRLESWLNLLVGGRTVAFHWRAVRLGHESRRCKRSRSERDGRTMPASFVLSSLLRFNWALVWTVPMVLQLVIILVVC